MMRGANMPHLLGVPDKVGTPTPAPVKPFDIFAWSRTPGGSGMEELPVIEGVNQPCGKKQAPRSQNFHASGLMNMFPAIAQTPPGGLAFRSSAW
mmetsp:Transcript_33765/g.54797  ORF Transcript_33765/g.54797 Transcript_33765/m.54797 type:complete len:94 (+) Transcript_33765:908-1189(+)